MRAVSVPYALQAHAGAGNRAIKFMAGLYQAPLGRQSLAPFAPLLEHPCRESGSDCADP